MNNIKFVSTLISLIVFSISLKGQNNHLASWIVTNDKVEYKSNENYVVEKLDSIFYSIDSIKFYKSKRYQGAFTGGKDSLSLFIENNLEFIPYSGVYPKIIIAFIINSSGEIIFPGVLRGAEESYNIAAMNVVKKMPKWIPAIKDGNKVASYNYVSIDFTIR